MAPEIDYIRGRPSSPRYSILKGWALNPEHDLASAMEVQRILKGLISSPLKIDDEEMVTIAELEAEARHQLSLALSFLKKNDRSLQAQDQARGILKKFASVIPEDCRYNFWVKPNVERIMADV